MSERPTLAEVRAYVGVPATTLSDADLQRIYDSCDASQRQRCQGMADDEGNPITDLPEPLNQAFMRRTQREVAARNLPLGMVGIDAEYGAQRLPAADALVDDLERPYRKQVLA